MRNESHYINFLKDVNRRQRNYLGWFMEAYLGVKGITLVEVGITIIKLVYENILGEIMKVLALKTLQVI